MFANLEIPFFSIYSLISGSNDVMDIIIGKLPSIIARYLSFSRICFNSTISCGFIIPVLNFWYNLSLRSRKSYARLKLMFLHISIFSKLAGSNSRTSRSIQRRDSKTRQGRQKPALHYCSCLLGHYLELQVCDKRRMNCLHDLDRKSILIDSIE